MANGAYDFQPIPEFNAQYVFSDYNLPGYTPIPNIPGTTQTGRDKSPGFDILGQEGQTLAAGLEGLGALGSAYSAYRQYQLGKDTLQQNRAAFNRNLANQAAITNAEIEDRALRRAAQRSDLAGDFEAIQAAADAEASRRRISGEPI